MNKADFSRQVYELLNRYGWTWFCLFEQSYYARRALGHGFPDIIALRYDDVEAKEPVGRLLVIVLKGTGHKVTPEQQGWLDLFEAVGAECHVWTPEVPGSEAMVEVLR